jgi:hypothetical protein
MSDENIKPDDAESFLLFGDVTDFDLFKAQVQSLFVALSNEIQKRLDENKASIENIEKQFALLFAGYAEQAAVIENLILTTFTDNPEKEKIFRDNLAETRKQFLNLLKEGAQDVLASEDPNAASAIEDAVNEKLSD